ncbi:heme o synthase [Burkholderiaceae bacterium DAT-1]|nr:heme o synthase [Burkholderiaceae bacterium DAT-1]
METVIERRVEAGLIQRLKSFIALSKPRVIMLIVFCAVIGMFLSVKGMPDWGTLAAATVGIGLVAGAAAAINCLVEQKIDAVMARTRARPLPRGQVSTTETLAFAGVFGLAGLAMLHEWVNPLTMWLTLATFVGYAIIYTLLLKPNTPQNIVIGGASGAMPPILGWAAMTGTVSHDAMLMFLIIFAWTPPHFWSLALYRKEEYARAGLPMLPVTHGMAFTQLHVFLYTVILTAITLLPFATRMSGWIYLVSVLLLDGIYLVYAWRIKQQYSDALARRAFRYSILYLTLLFAALLVDHYVPIM